MGADAPSLLTFAPMIDSEFSRLVLKFHQVAYREEDHLFGWASVLTLFHGGYGRIPLLYGKDIRVTSPRKMAAHFDALVPDEHRLTPAGRRQPVTAEVERYNGQYAIDVATFAYFHLLPERSLMEPLFAGPVPPGEARLSHAAYPFMRALFKLLLRLGPERAEAGRVRILQLFEYTDAQLSDGRPYLLGDRLTLGDLALLSSSAPLLLPEGYGTAMPPPDKLPAPIRALREELAGSRTDAFVRRVYRDRFTAPEGSPR